MRKVAKPSTRLPAILSSVQCVSVCVLGAPSSAEQVCRPTTATVYCSRAAEWITCTPSKRFRTDDSGRDVVAVNARLYTIEAAFRTPQHTTPNYLCCDTVEPENTSYWPRICQLVYQCSYSISRYSNKQYICIINLWNMHFHTASSAKPILTALPPLANLAMGSVRSPHFIDWRNRLNRTNVALQKRLAVVY